jgi:hypothetical protein
MTDSTDDDFALALALQKEEDELIDSSDEEDFNDAKKRKVAL